MDETQAREAADGGSASLESWEEWEDGLGTRMLLVRRRQVLSLNGISFRTMGTRSV